jgi:hypothetical protein
MFVSSSNYNVNATTKNGPAKSQSDSEWSKPREKNGDEESATSNTSNRFQIWLAAMVVDEPLSLSGSSVFR